MTKKPFWRRMLVPTGLLVVAGGTLLTIVSSTFTRARGATRSRMLEFERRERVIDQTIRETSSQTQDSSMLPCEQNEDFDTPVARQLTDG